MKDVPDFKEREDAVAEATDVSRADLEALGFTPEPTRPDIHSDGWVLRASLTNKNLSQFKCYPAGDFVVVTGRQDA